MRGLAAFLSGLLFGTGLIVSGMSDPARVTGFLDMLGAWDPSLAFVLAGAVVTTFVGYRLAWRRPAPLLARRFSLPASRAVDGTLLVGATVFGVGWGLAGFCPGPALVALPIGASGTLVFVPAMLAGMAVARRFGRDRAPAAASPPPTIANEGVQG